MNFFKLLCLYLVQRKIQLQKRINILDSFRGIAALIVFLGDQLGVGSQMSTGVVVVLTMRIFANVAAIRRHLLKA